MLKEIGKLDNMSSDQALLEENFLNRITALQLRIRRKVYQKFVNYTREQLVQQIKAVLKPPDENKSVENLLLTTFEANQEQDATTDIQVEADTG